MDKNKTDIIKKALIKMAELMERNGVTVFSRPIKRANGWHVGTAVVTFEPVQSEEEAVKRASDNMQRGTNIMFTLAKAMKDIAGG